MQTDTVNGFLAAMADDGVPFGGKDAFMPDGKLHRYQIANDTKHRKAGWYIFHDDPPASGGYGDHRSNFAANWTAKAEKSCTPEERAIFAKRNEEARRKREEEKRRQHDKGRRDAISIWQDSADCAGHPYLTKKHVQPHGLRVTTRAYDIATPSDRTFTIQNGSLVIPLRDVSGVIWSLQFITPAGAKWYLPGAEKAAHFHPMSAGKSKATTNVLIVEGYATGATCFASGVFECVVCALDASNLEPVAKALRDAYPGATITIGADNDQWTQMNDGTPNPGLTLAKKAANTVGGTVVYPVFDDQSITTYAAKYSAAKPTDWNDLLILTNAEEVARQLQGIVSAPAETIVTESVDSPYFLPLGYNHNTCYFLSVRAKQVIAVDAARIGKQFLLQLAPLFYWEREYPRAEGFGGQAVDRATSSLISQCLNKGVFQADRLRGRGVWWDDGRLVFHAGDRLVIDCEEVGLQHHTSHYVYEALPATKTTGVAVSQAEAYKLHTLCTALCWENPSFGAFLAGWLVIAPVCGALTWRPHLWITGPSGSGKSWALQRIIMKALGRFALAAQGETTAAGIRQALGHDARPVVLDEAEGESHRAAENLQSILALVRASSSDESGNILKGGKDGLGISYATKAIFCLSAIVPQLKQTADQNRIIVLSMRDHHSEADRRRFHDQVQPIAAELLTEDFCIGLRNRTIKNLATLQKNIVVFSTVLAELLGSERMADQYAPLAAGDYLLHCTKEITIGIAKEWIARQNWNETHDIASTKDELRLVAHIAESRVEVAQEQGPTVKYTIGELIAIAAAKKYANVSEKGATEALERCGIKVRSGTVWISNTHRNLIELLRDTPWCQGWGRILGRIPEVEKNKIVRFGTVCSKATGIPIDVVISSDDPA